MPRKWNPKRRRLLKLAATAAASGVSCTGSKRFGRFFTIDEAQTAEAICSCLIPSDDFPGAAWAGAVKFIDRHLAGHLRKYGDVYRRGLAATDQASAAQYGVPFAKLATEKQVELLTAIETGRAAAAGWTSAAQREFFGLILAHTMQSFYGDPRHGGNREGVGYRMIGLTLTPVRGREQHDLTVIANAPPSGGKL